MAVVDTASRKVSNSFMKKKEEKPAGGMKSPEIPKKGATKPMKSGGKNSTSSLKCGSPMTKISATSVKGSRP